MKAPKSFLQARPVKHLQEFNKRYPNASKFVDSFRKDRGKDIPDWPDWCFLPMSAYYAIVSAEHKLCSLPISLISNVTNLTALNIWRITQGIYRFDEALEDALMHTEITGDMPTEVFFRLPEWCVYIETNNISYFDNRVRGFFVHLEHDLNTGRSELRILLDLDETLYPVILHLGKWSIVEAVRRAFIEANKNVPRSINRTDEHFCKTFANEAQPLLSLILYLCSEQPEYSGGKPRRAEPVKTKKGYRFFPPDSPKIIEVGKRIGHALRAFSENIGVSDPNRSVRPHMRRGHWHRYWIGKRNEGKKSQKIVFKWLAPMGVNTDYLMNERNIC